MGSITEGDLHVTGAFSAKTMTIAASAVTNASIAAAAAIDATKLVERHRINFPGLIVTAGPVAGTYKGHLVTGATGNVIACKAGFTTKPTAGSWTIDLKKNGSTILSSVISLGTGITNNTPVAGTIQTAPVVVDDYLEFVIADVGSTGGLGLFIILVVDEDAQ